MRDKALAFESKIDRRNTQVLEILIVESEASKDLEGCFGKKPTLRGCIDQYRQMWEDAFPSPAFQSRNAMQCLVGGLTV